ncbi:hypothetical protein ONS95_000504 [Cadophora gregata]|uniref:uncharacterized protein n=1 Tax=Cadophora gregata TaxID=51156 RepID=UPI0026DDB0B8|nr:uncharacterized protein ONS95_000504 [Cadophora gregata]KAK0125489.1 hypothetical protein ONS96_009326 [Cadophora gregata f. sp. sojae]KAK0128537.1 hypothetical protein ONS95_000504 [Cadophora gregata]
MATFALLCFVLLNPCLIPNVSAKEGSKSVVRWDPTRSQVGIGLATPDLFYWDQDSRVTTDYYGAFIFDLRLTSDNLTVLLNGEPILPRARAYVPARLRAPQVGLVEDSGRYRPINLGNRTVMDLDYYIDSPDTSSSTSIYNTKYNPRIIIDILRVRIPTLPGYSAPLASNAQENIWIWLEDLSEHPPGTPYANIPLKISRVQVNKRWLNHDSEGTDTYKSLKSLRGCYIWSWLCADVDEYPYYEYVYQENFDEYGKKGSMRHFLTRRWGNMVILLGYWRAAVLLAVCGSMVLSPFIYAVYRGVKDVFDIYKMRMKEVDDWVADEDVDGWLESDRLFEDFGYDEKEGGAQKKKKEAAKEKEKEGEKTNVEEFLPSPPPYPEVEGKDLLVT